MPGCPPSNTKDAQVSVFFLFRFVIRCTSDGGGRVRYIVQYTKTTTYSEVGRSAKHIHFQMYGEGVGGRGGWVIRFQHQHSHQAETRARKRYPRLPDADGFYVRGREEKDGTWTPVPCPCAHCLRAPAPAARFATAEEGVQHELGALRARRDSWKNLAPADQAMGKHVSAEHDSTREAVEAEGEATRSEVREIRTHLLQQGEKQSAIREERAKLSAVRNEA